jgi:uncharacterized protein (TIGR02145 family)
MKKIYLTLAAIAAVLGATAQNAPTKMNIKLVNSTEVVTYNISDIEEITFTEDGQKPDEPLPVDAKTYVISIPAVTSDLEPGVWKVMNGDEQVAELCYEYIRYAEGDNLIANERMLVLYPMGQDGLADLTKGYVVSNGGSLVWDITTNTCTYTAGAATTTPVTVFLAEGRFATASEAEDKVTTTQLKDQLVDKRGNETETYDVVKVGTQYWMGQNLRTTMLTDGRSIAMFKATQGDAWNNTTAPAYHVYGDGEVTEIKETWGCMYNGYSVFDGNLAPEGWDITTLEDWQLLKNYLAAGQSGKVKSLYGWLDTPGNGNNLTGLDIQPGGLFVYTESTNDEYQSARATYWTSDELEDALFHTPALGAVYIYNSIAVYNTEGKPFATHGYNWGHYVRCLRR